MVVVREVAKVINIKDQVKTNTNFTFLREKMNSEQEKGNNEMGFQNKGESRRENLVKIQLEKNHKEN